MDNYKLQNIVYPLRRNGELLFPWSMCCKGPAPEAVDDNNVLTLEPGQSADFSTYFNALSLLRWKRFTVAEHFSLTLDFEGEAKLRLITLAKKNTRYYDSSFTRTVIKEKKLLAPARRTFSIGLPRTGAPLISFELEAQGPCRLFGGAYYAEAKAEQVRPVSMAIATTTFRKEKFITDNLELLKKYVFYQGSELENRLCVHVVDNGRTLDPTGLEDEHIAIHPNPNTGGSGGYARGMIEALHMRPRPTHVLLMDDDVQIMPESFFRTYYLLRLVRGEYAEAFVSGAMFDFLRRTLQYEDVGAIKSLTGAFGSLKWRKYKQTKEYFPDRRYELDMALTQDVVYNELLTVNRKASYMYSGWWYCCIPMTCIEKYGLPLPLFVRGDDVEYALRSRKGLKNKYKFVSMNGISIWHMGFTEKFSAAMELYQVHRNSLIIRAATGVAPRAGFLLRIFTYYHKELTRFAYDNAGQVLDAVEDFMTGPEFLENNSGEQLLKKHNALNDQLRPASELTDDPALLNSDPRKHVYCSPLQRLVYYATLNGHWMRKLCRYREEPAAVSNGWEYSLKTNYMRMRLFSLNYQQKTAVWHERDQKRFDELEKRADRVFRDYFRNHKKIEARYRERAKFWITEDFWRQYLGMDRSENNP